MMPNGKLVEMMEETSDWTVERIFTGERLSCGLQAEMADAIDLAVSQVGEAKRLLSRHEIAGIIVHSLLETAIRQIMMSKMPVSLQQFEDAARLVYVNCHQHEGDEGHAHSH